MTRNQLIILIIGISIAVFVGGTMGLILFYAHRQRKRLSELGDIDEELKKEYLSNHKNKVFNYAFKGFETVLLLGLVAVFTFFTIQRIQGERFNFGGQDMYVVRSGSMRYVNPKNPDYEKIVEHKYRNQFDVFDIVIVKDKPEQELVAPGVTSLVEGQVIMYKYDDRFIIHRISKIEYSVYDQAYKYTCCGDANTSHDGAIEYKDIVAVYTDHKIPFVGIFILWIQSPLGYVVIGIILVYGIYSSYLDRKINEYTIERLVKIQYLIPYENKFHHIKYKINPNPPKFIKDDDDDDDAEPLTVTHYRHRAYVVTLSRFDIVNVDRLNRYNFETPTKSVYKCHHFHTQRIKCYNTQYVCVKVWFRCNHATIIKYLFFNRIKNFKYRTIALKQINYLIHSGRLNNYIKLQLDLMEEKNASK